MKSQTLILLIVAAGCGLVAMLGIQRVLNKKGEDETPKVQVLQASVDISLGQKLTEANTQFVSVDVSAVPQGAVTDLEQIRDRSVLIPVQVGDWITVKKLSEVGDTGISVKIPSGMQVATIPVDPTTSHSGMLQPGHRVDLMINYEHKNEIGERTQKVRRILQYVEVFAVDDKVYGLNDDAQIGKAKNISLLVTPEQSLFLELAKTQGRMSTVLRGNGDDEQVDSEELSVSELDQNELPELNDRSARDSGPVSEFEVDQASSDSLLDELQSEFGDIETGPTLVAVPAVEETWQIAIWEGTSVRVDVVNLHSDTPIPVNGNLTAPVVPVQGDFGVTVPPDAHSAGGQQGLKDDTASDLWSLFGD
ncbi:MAG: Flp pilus assembly protein CpaB [Fuerstiella sp.]|nr:Flp pilus assembly protein CpaB [Fuerstiella sp.]